MDDKIQREEKPKKDDAPWHSVHKKYWSVTVAKAQGLSPTLRRELSKGWKDSIDSASKLMDRSGCSMKKAFDYEIAKAIISEHSKDSVV